MTMSRLLTYHEKQLVLYSKGHFKQSENIIDDLKVIVAAEYEIPIGSTQFHHVHHYVIKTFLKLHEAGYMQESMRDFLEGLFTWDQPTLDSTIMIQKRYFPRIAWVKVEGLNLGDADGSLLPLQSRETVK